LFIVKLVALWRNFQRHQSTNPPEVSKMWARIVSLENEVSNLKVLESEVKQLKILLEVLYQEIATLDQEITEGRIQREALRKRASEAENQRVESLVQLAYEVEARDNLVAKLGSS